MLALRDPARKVALLDLLLVKGEGFMGEVVICGCLGLTDHKVFEFQIIDSRIKTASRTLTVDMRRADFGLLKELASKVPWELALQGIGVHECWFTF